MVSPGAKRSLTAEAFGKFLRWFSENDEQAVREYQSVRVKLVRYFVHKGCADPDELFDKTVDIVVGKIDTCKDCASPLAYCYGVAKNIWRQDLRERKHAALDQDTFSSPHPELALHEQELKCLERCMNQLSPNDRDIVIRYHQGQGREKIVTRGLLADGLGGMNALRIRMCRIRKDLRVCVVQCVERSAD